MIVVLSFVWWLIGVAGFVYWWTVDDDIEIGTVPLACMAGLLGPVAWLVGHAIHGGRRSSPGFVLIRRRSR